MPKELVRIDMDLVHPEFIKRALAVLAACKARGVQYYWVEGFRSWDRSRQLYTAYQLGGPRAAPPGSSGHNFGIAGDFCRDTEPDVPGLQPSWAPADYAVLIEEAKKVGLSPGANYKDYPHLEFPHLVTAEELSPLKRIWLDNQGKDTLTKLKLVWDYVDSEMPNIPALEDTNDSGG